MLVPDEVRKCVVFICYESKDGTKLVGTAFFVGIPSIIPDKVYPYLVTAKHVIERIKEKSIDGKVYIRLNEKKSRVDISTDINQWKFHPTAANVDVAVFYFSLDMDLYDFRMIPKSLTATSEIIIKEKIGLGDEVFLTGLFSNHYGRERNIPIIRIGNIASMPEEPVHTKDMGDIDAYLIEARSIGGLSGSPVFVHLGLTRLFNGQVMLANGHIYYWLGLIHGHFDLGILEQDEIAEDNLIDLKVNMGIAIVVPVSKIIEVLYQDELVKSRQFGDEAYLKQKTASSDSI